MERLRAQFTCSSGTKSQPPSDTPDPNHFRITAVVAPIGKKPTFVFDDLFHALHVATFDVDKSKVPDESRCSCLAGGRNCKTAEHWVVEFTDESDFYQREDGTKYTGKIAQYDGSKRGQGEKIFVGVDGSEDKWLWCVERLNIEDRDPFYYEKYTRDVRNARGARRS